MKILVLIALIMQCLSCTQGVTAQNTIPSENGLYSVEELHDVFLSRMQDTDKTIPQKEKDTKLLYSLGMYTDSLFTIGYKPGAMKEFSFENLDTSTEEWTEIRNSIYAIILDSEGSVVEPYKEEQDRQQSQCYMTVKISSISTINTLTEMEEVRFIEVGALDHFLVETEFYEYLGRSRAEYSSGERLEKSRYTIRNNKVYHSGRELKGCNADHFRRVEASSYWTDGTKVYWAGKPLPEVDARTFTTANGAARDKNHVYSREKILIGADPQTYGELSSDGKKRYTRFSRDSFRIYHNRVQLTTADYETFEVLAYQGSGESSICWARDKNHVYWNTYVVEGADPATIVVLNEHQAKDDDEDAFILKQHKVQIDPATFVNYPNGMIKSSEGVYLISGKLLEEADPLTYTYLNEWYQKDANHLFSRGNILENADLESFQVSENPDVAYDKGQTYFQGKIMK
ncbi:MAG: DKNYY domain-containing protein [Bacteroidota bacterium]